MGIAKPLHTRCDTQPREDGGLDIDRTYCFKGKVKEKEDRNRQRES